MIFYKFIIPKQKSLRGEIFDYFAHEFMILLQKLQFQQHFIRYFYFDGIKKSSAEAGYCLNILDYFDYELRVFEENCVYLLEENSLFQDILIINRFFYLYFLILS